MCFLEKHKFDWFKESSVLLKSGEIIFFLSIYWYILFRSKNKRKRAQ